jgi:hypothetical protein
MQKEIKIIHENINIYFSEILLNKLIELQDDLYIDSFISYVKDIFTKSFVILKNKRINIDKIKNSITYFKIEFKDNSINKLGYHTVKLNDKRVNYITILFNENDLLNLNNIDSFVDTVIHEIGHAIDHKFLNQEARDYWQSGWYNAYADQLSAIRQSVTDKKPFTLSDSIRIQKRKIAKGMISTIQNKYQELDFSEDNVKNCLFNFIDIISKIYNALKNQPFFIEYFKDLERFGNLCRKEFIENKKLNKIEKTELGELFMSLSDKTKLENILFNKSLSQLNSDDYSIIIMLFSFKDLNILGKPLYDPKLDLLNDAGCFLILGLINPKLFMKYLTGELFSPLFDKFISTFRNSLSLDIQSSDIEIQNEIKNIFILENIESEELEEYDPLNFDPKRLNLNPQETATLYKLPLQNLDLKYLQIPTEYGKLNMWEDFAETFRLYILDPNSLSDIAKTRISRTLWLSGFYGQRLEEKLIRKISKLLAKGF